MTNPIPHKPPAPVDLVTVGGNLRFGVGEPNGRRSCSWGVMANSNSRDVYLGPRRGMNIIKMSLHKSGQWRLAYTTEGARALGIVGNRLIHAYEVPREMVPGWRMAAVIEIPESSLSTRTTPETGKVQWWPEPDVGFALMFQVWITDSEEADVRGLTIMTAGCAGSFFLHGGGSVFVFVDEQDITQHEAKIQSARTQNYEHNQASSLNSDDDFFSFGVGGDDTVDIPWLVDLGNLRVLLGSD